MQRQRGRRCVTNTSSQRNNKTESLAAWDGLLHISITVTKQQKKKLLSIFNASSALCSARLFKTGTKERSSLSGNVSFSFFLLLRFPLFLSSVFSFFNCATCAWQHAAHAIVISGVNAKRRNSNNNKKKTPDTPVSVTFFFFPFFKRGSFLCLSIMQPYPYAPSNQTYTYGAPPPPQQPYGGYSQQPPPPPQQGCYAPTPYANYPPAPPPQGGCYAIPSTGSYPPPPRPFPPQPPMQPNVPPAANYVLGGPGYPPLAPPVNNYDPRRNDYRY